MNPLRSAFAGYFRRPQPSRTSLARRSRPWLEILEDRTVPSASISIADASLNELGTASALVSAGSGGLSAPKDVVQGPDGNVYVASSGTNSVLRYNGSTGAFIDAFVAAGSGGLGSPYGVAFGPDGNLYVPSGTNNDILRYNGTTGAFIDTFVASSSGGMNKPGAVAFGSDGNLYVVDDPANAVLRYQGPSGASPGAPLPAAGQTGATFVAAGSGGLSFPTDLAFGPDGNLYVNNTANTLAVLKFDGATGAFLSTAVAPGSGGLSLPRGLAVDQDGRVYVADQFSNAVHRYDSTGQYLDDPVVGSPNSVTVAIGLALDAQGRLLLSGKQSNTVVRYDRGVTATLSAASATPVSVGYATSAVSATAGADYTEQAGTVTFAPGQTSRLILLATHDDVLIESNETFTVQLSKPTGGATIGTGTAAATIVDDDNTRQITVSDATATEGDTAGKFLDTFVSQGSGGLGIESGGMAYGPGGNLYIASGGRVLRYNGTTGNFMDVFAPVGPGGLPRGLIFMPGGDLLVAYESTGNIARFDGTTGAYLGTFTNGRALTMPRAMTFGPDGNFYVNSETGPTTCEIDRFNGATGAFMGVFAASGSGGLDDPWGFAFGADGNLYVGQPNDVLRFKGTTGAFMDQFVPQGTAGMGQTREIAFGPDGNLYVGDATVHGVLRFDGTTGAYLGLYGPTLQGADAMGTLNLAFAPDGNLLLSGYSKVLRYGPSSQAAFTVTLSTPSSLPLTVDFTTGNGTALSGSDYTSKSGTVTFDPGATSRGIIVRTVDDTTIELPETFNVTLSNPVGAVIADGQGVGTISDNDSTKFFVVDDSSADRTYRYGITGNTLANSTLGSGNTAPRGVAAKADGSTYWVVDANKNVYVYAAGGGLQGSWTAGSLSGSAQLEGIATNGTDIWLLDRKQGKVFKYAGAASRTSGSQSASSSFALASGNSTPKDMVTDGTSLWIVDANKTVYKYTLAGSLLGSWTIDPANTSPTGITINPNNVSDVWIADSGTKKVYQYAGAASRTSGSQIVSAVFALSSNDNNPQGIADPPPPETLLTPASRPALPEAASVVPFNIASARAANAVAATASLANREAVFALAFAESLPKPGERSPGLTASGGSPTAGTDRALTPAGAFGGLNAMDYFAPLTWATGDGVRSDHRAVDLWDGVWAGDESLLSAGVTDSFFARLEEDAAAGE
jgi:glucose/arabinose dehydrogenase